MTIDVACAYLGALPREMFLASVATSLRPFRLPGGAIRYDRQELDSWVDARGYTSPRRPNDYWLRKLEDDTN